LRIDDIQLHHRSDYNIDNIPKKSTHVNIFYPEVWAFFPMFETRFACMHDADIIEVFPERAIWGKIACRDEFHKIVLRDNINDHILITKDNTYLQEILPQSNLRMLKSQFLNILRRLALIICVLWHESLSRDIK
jgi:hypothetical protein